MANNSQLAYSTDTGYVREQKKPQKKKPQKNKRTKRQQQASVIKNDGIVRVRLEKKGRGGKTVTTISGVAVAGPELKALASELKRKCGSGGSIVDGIIEIQGDKADRVIDELTQRGYQAKRAGG